MTPPTIWVGTSVSSSQGGWPSHGSVASSRRPHRSPPSSVGSPAGRRAPDSPRTDPAPPADAVTGQRRRGRTLAGGHDRCTPRYNLDPPAVLQVVGSGLRKPARGRW